MDSAILWAMLSCAVFGALCGYAGYRAGLSDGFMAGRYHSPPPAPPPPTRPNPKKPVSP